MYNSFILPSPASRLPTGLQQNLRRLTTAVLLTPYSCILNILSNFRFRDEATQDHETQENLSWPRKWYGQNPVTWTKSFRSSSNRGADVGAQRLFSTEMARKEECSSLSIVTCIVFCSFFYYLIVNQTMLVIQFNHKVDCELSDSWDYVYIRSRKKQAFSKQQLNQRINVSFLQLLTSEIVLRGEKNPSIHNEKEKVLEIPMCLGKSRQAYKQATNWKGYWSLLVLTRQSKTVPGPQPAQGQAWREEASDVNANCIFAYVLPDSSCYHFLSIYVYIFLLVYFIYNMILISSIQNYSSYINY